MLVARVVLHAPTVADEMKEPAHCGMASASESGHWRSPSVVYVRFTCTTVLKVRPAYCVQRSCGNSRQLSTSSVGPLLLTHGVTHNIT